MKSKVRGIPLKYIHDFALFIYLCTFTGHQLGQLGTGFDAIAVRVAFVLYVAVGAFILLVDRKIRLSPLLIWYILFVIWYFISVFWAKDTSLVFYYFNQFVQIIAIFLILPQRIKSYDDIFTFIKLIIASLAYSALLLFIKTPLSDWGSERIGRGIGLHPNDIGMRFAVGLLLCIGILTITKCSKLEKIANIFLIVCFILIVLFSGSRKSIVLALLGVLGYVVFSKPSHIKGKQMIKYLMIFLLACGAIAAIIYLMFNNEMLYNVLGKRFDIMLEGDGADASVEGRNLFIGFAMTLFAAHPILGYGGNNFVKYMYEINYSNKVYCHNNFWEILSTLGIIGFLIYYWFIFVLAFQYVMTLRIVKDNSLKKLFGLFFIILILEVVLSWWNVNYMGEFLHIIFALLYFGLDVYKKSNSSPDKQAVV